MPMTKYTYVDSCVFLAYLQNETGRAGVIEQLFDEMTRQNSRRKLMTSVISITEVSHGAHERQKSRLDPDFELKVDGLWDNRALVEFVENHEVISRNARALIRRGIPHQYALKPADATHLVSAQLMGVDEFFTYDEKLFKYASWLGFAIVEPYVNQLGLGI